MTCYCYSITIINITFQLTSSRRGWLNQTAALLCYFYFNSHPHEEDDDATTKAKLTDTVFQLTSSRRGWHTLLNGSSFANGISTHILTKRMTVLFPYWVCCHNISTHILTKRMTPKCVSLSIPLCISTHILTKRMTDCGNYKTRFYDISTHILTKRMTLISMLIHNMLHYFNSHPHEEDDLSYLFYLLLFNISTHILTERMTLAF